MASNNLERDLTQASIGYLSKDEYKRKREELEGEKALLALKRIADGSGGAAGTSSSATDDAAPTEGKKAKRSKKDKAKQLNALSFGDELDEGENEPSPSLLAKSGFSAAREREKQEEAAQQEAKLKEILAQQQRARQESIQLQYTFRSELTQRELPKGVHRGTVTVRKGLTAEEVAVAVRTDVEGLGGKFAPNSVQGIREEREVALICCCSGQSSGSFMVPGAVTLVELAMRRWSEGDGSSGPAMLMFDDFAHGIVVTERRYYEAQKHTFPYSYWRQYESQRDYSFSEWQASRNKAESGRVGWKS